MTFVRVKSIKNAFSPLKLIFKISIDIILKILKILKKHFLCYEEKQLTRLLQFAQEEELSPNFKSHIKLMLIIMSDAGTLLQIPPDPSRMESSSNQFILQTFIPTISSS